MSSLLTADNNSDKWNTLQGLQSRYPRWNPVCIDQSIWISVDYDHGERGMVEYCCKTNTMKQSFPYPKDFKPYSQSICGPNGSTLVVVDGVNGKLIEFDAKNQKYGPTVSIPKLGENTSCIMAKNTVHIMHGNYNTKNRYLIYSMTTGQVTEFTDNLQIGGMQRVSITKQTDAGRADKICKFWIRSFLPTGSRAHGDVVDLVVKYYFINMEFYMFGGKNLRHSRTLNSFYIGKLQKDDVTKPIIWEKAEYFKLKRPLVRCGVIQCGPYIAIFGGSDGSAIFGGPGNCTNFISILDVRLKSGWIDCSIKCPIKEQCVAVLDYKQNAHIFTSGGNEHYSISVKKLIPGWTA